ncbi:unnamed protein product [Durusdinium trenchii]|uniref:Lysosomal Pro-X carboxypeptidase n=1 Tax=Durusdinium trenchii TaxID=1381693 RepID=A0ABP0ICN7_9DINO
MGVGPQKLILLLLPAFSCGTPRTATPPRAIGHRVWQQAPALQDAEKRPSTENCTWRNFTQRIDHFGATEGTFPQRLCIYDHWWRRAASGEELPRHKTSPGPIFFYTGNESPVGVYVNQTGLMWELAPSFGALIVFAEHRCEPSSVWKMCGQQAVEDCVGYCTSAQALADYAAIIAELQATSGGPRAPVVAFGGSYGGMLAGWMRMKMPEVIDGAIAASAPIWQLATTVTRESLDWPYQAITRGVSSFGGASERCVENLRVAWPLIEGGLSSTLGLSLLSKRVHSCEPLQEVKQFTAWAQETYFLLAEGNYPFPSSYIPTAVGEGGTMPAWPMRVACEPLSRDFGFRVESGELEKVHYTIRMGDLKVTVHWDQLHSNGAQLNEKQLHASGILELAAALADSVAVWYNVSKTKTCWDIPAEPSSPAAAEGTDDQSLLQSMKDRGCCGCSLTMLATDHTAAISLKHRVPPARPARSAVAVRSADALRRRLHATTQARCRRRLLGRVLFAMRICRRCRPGAWAMTSIGLLGLRRFRGTTPLRVWWGLKAFNQARAERICRTKAFVVPP